MGQIGIFNCDSHPQPLRNYSVTPKHLTDRHITLGTGELEYFYNIIFKLINYK